MLELMNRSEGTQICGTDAITSPETSFDNRDDTRSIIVKDALSECVEKEDMYGLWSEGIEAIRIKHVATPEQCRQLCKNASTHKDRKAHAAVDQLHILGLSHYVTIGNAEAERRYYDNARKFVSAIRQMSIPQGSPMDGVYSVLSDGWPAGVIPGRLDTGRPMPPCIFRFNPPNSPGVAPHIDDLRQEVPHSRVADSLIGQFGFNLYLSMPESGGELLIFDRKPSLAEFRAKATGYSWPQQFAGEPKHVITPEIGELILINTRQLHAVGACFGQGCRATLSGFGGAINEEDPMMIWA